jgi:hypothetical protein
MQHFYTDTADLTIPTESLLCSTKQVDRVRERIGIAYYSLQVEKAHVQWAKGAVL